MQNTERTTSSLDLALAIWHRRKWPAVLIFVALLFTSVAVVRSLPNIYESTATVLVERPQVPDRFSASGASADIELETRLRTLSQQIQSRSRLYDLITRFHLYPELGRKTNTQALVDQMRRDIQLQFTGVQEPLLGVDVTFGFRLSYRGRDPETVAQVTNALAALYVEENARSREQQTTGTTEFLRKQLDEAEQKLNEQERRVSAFTDRHRGELPEQQAANLAALARLNEQLVVTMDRRNELARQLADFPRAGYSISARLARLRQDLADLRTRDTEEHPDVVRVKQEIADLERQLAANGGGPAGGDPRAVVEAELTTLRNQEQDTRRAIATYEQHVANAPLTEQEFQGLSRDYAAAKSQYQSLLQRYEDAQLAARMAEQHPQGEQFRILDPAVATGQPVAPHRLRLLLMCLVVAVGAALGVAFLTETIDTSFHTVDEVRAFTSVPVLATIPPIVTDTDARQRRQRFGLAVFAATLGVGAVTGAASYLARSNDALVHLLAGRF